MQIPPSFGPGPGRCPGVGGLSEGEPLGSRHHRRRRDRHGRRCPKSGGRLRHRDPHPGRGMQRKFLPGGFRPPLPHRRTHPGEVGPRGHPGGGPGGRLLPQRHGGSGRSPHRLGGELRPGELDHDRGASGLQRGLLPGQTPLPRLGGPGGGGGLCLPHRHPLRHRRGGPRSGHVPLL